jgi:hypothetical protein
VIASFEQRQTSSRDCLKSQAFAPLQDVAKARILNEFMLGTGVLQWTSHSAMAGPYHRDAAGTMTMINALRADPDTAKPMIMASAADYVLICAALPETAFYTRHAAGGVQPQDTLIAQLKADAPPSWLKRMPMAGTPLQLYEIQR